MSKWTGKCQRKTVKHVCVAQEARGDQADEFHASVIHVGELRPLPSQQGHQLLGDWPEQDTQRPSSRPAPAMRSCGFLEVSGICIWSSVNVYN